MGTDVGSHSESELFYVIRRNCWSNMKKHSQADKLVVLKFEKDK